MGNRIIESHVRVRTNLRREWIWELITADGHVASASEAYADRERCEAAARELGLRIVGGRKVVRGRQQHRPQPGLRVFANATGLWRWEDRDDAGDIRNASALAFLTRDECERDAARSLGSLIQACRTPEPQFASA